MKGSGGGKTGKGPLRLKGFGDEISQERVQKAEKNNREKTLFNAISTQREKPGHNRNGKLGRKPQRLR